jgi:flagellar motor switch protein FliM
MTEGASTRAPLLRFALEGERVRKAVSALERESSRLVAAVRRAVPFLSRRAVPIALSYARALPMAELLDTLMQPIHLTHFVTKPGQATGALLLDAGAVALLLDGVLGGDGQTLPELNPAGLSGPQQALVGGVAGNILRSLSVALQASLGLVLESRTPSNDHHQVQSAPIVCVLELGEGAVTGHVALLLAREPLLTSAAPDEPASACADDPRIVAVLEEVELLLVVELGRVPMKVRQLTSLKVGDTLRLDVPVNGFVTVRANERELMRGRPTSSGGRIAVKIVPTAHPVQISRHEP